MFSHFYFTPFKLVNTGMWVWKKKPIREKKETEKICFSFRDIHYRNWKFCYAARCGAGWIFAGWGWTAPPHCHPNFNPKKKEEKEAWNLLKLRKSHRSANLRGIKLDSSVGIFGVTCPSLLNGVWIRQIKILGHRATVILIKCYARMITHTP